MRFSIPNWIVCVKTMIFQLLSQTPNPEAQVVAPGAPPPNPEAPVVVMFVQQFEYI
jgi:hypothetical protein